MTKKTGRPKGREAGKVEAIMYLRNVKRMKYRDIAKELGIPKNTVEGIIYDECDGSSDRPLKVPDVKTWNFSGMDV